jgi:hypothetical protein
LARSTRNAPRSKMKPIKECTVKITLRRETEGVIFRYDLLNVYAGFIND